MNKLVVVLGVAAVATLAGCKDPSYNRIGAEPQDEVKTVDAESSSEAVKTEASVCKCAPGTKHDKPCECGDPNCQCITEAKAVEPEYTVYIVQRGDYLGKIANKYKLSVSEIKKLNNLKDDKVRLGQKLKLPGRVEVGEQKVPEGAVKKAPAKKPYASYKGETKEYVVKSGDTLGKIAYANGMNIRQLKELNGLTKDTLRIGQKLKVGVKAGAPAPKPEDTAVPPQKTDDVVAPTTEDTAPKTGGEDVVAPTTEDTAPKAGTTTAPAPTAGDVTVYTVREGDTLPRLSIDFEVPLARIRELNDLGENDELKPGQVLKIPAAQ